MSDITADGMAIAPGVVETIVTLATREVPGVASVGAAPSPLRSLLTSRQSTQGVAVVCEDDGTVRVELSLYVSAGRPLPEVASDVRSAVSDAVLAQAGLSVSRIDIRVDGIQFQD